MLFTNFNTATGYSGPSAIRLLRGACGQEKNEDLYNPASEECYLFENFRKIGYRTFTVLNHDGGYDDFSKQIVSLGRADPPIGNKELSASQLDFDQSPVYDDLQVLEKWFAIRNKSGAARAVLYYNTVTLHAGAHRFGEALWWLKSRKTHYKECLLGMFKEFDRFFGELAASGRNYMVIFVPEHGAALAGKNIQPADLREIPLPSITLVPVGIKLVGPGFPHPRSGPRIISKPTSFLALTYVISEMLKNVPISRINPENIPETPYVSEGENNQIVRKGNEYYLKEKGKSWVKLPAMDVR
jgi:cellulose synthase operon protein YhjU